MKGYLFGDNKMNVRMGPDDGYLTASLNGDWEELYRREKVQYAS